MPSLDRRRDLLWLVTGALLLRVLTAWPMDRPGYMDAAYYLDSALGLYEGHGFNLPLIWNYLTPAASLPAPSHLYWMPLTALPIVLSFWVLGPTFRAAQVPSILLSSALPALAYLVAYRTSLDLAPGRPKRARLHGLVSGLLAAFSGFYTAYWATPDSFALFALVGALCLWALGRAWKPSPDQGRVAWYAAAGLCAGLAHLARADGVLLLVTGLGAGVYALARQAARGGSKQQALRLVARLSLLMTCYLVVMAPWFLRNLRLLGSLLPAAGLKTLWLTDYDDLFGYQTPLTLSTYLDWGWGNILRSKLQALWLNAQTVLVVGWMIALAPLGLLGVWRLRRRAAFRLAGLYGLLLYLTMSLAFTFPGWRGGMLHSTVALLPFLYAAAIEGLHLFVLWAARRRSTWKPRLAKRVLSTGLILIALALSVWLYAADLDRFRGPHLYDQAGAWLRQHASEDARVLVNDPASFYWHARLPSLPIPNGDVEVVLRVMEDYDADYLLVDPNNPSLRALYDAPESEDRLIWKATFSDERTTAHLFARAPGSDH